VFRGTLWSEKQFLFLINDFASFLLVRATINGGKSWLGGYSLRPLPFEILKNAEKMAPQANNKTVRRKPFDKTTVVY